MMTNRERMLAVLDGKSPDRIPWMPRLELWYEARQVEGNMPERYRGLTLRQLERAVGAGAPARQGRVFKVRHEGMEVRETRRGREILEEYITPVGTVSKLRIISDEIEGQGHSGAIPREFFIKRVEDYGVMEYVYEHTYWEPVYETFLAYEQEIGDDGYPMVGVGDCPFHFFLLDLAGYQNSYFELVDHLLQVEHLLKVMEQVEIERLWPVVWNSPARLFNHGAHYDSQMTPPHLFDRYIKPYYLKIAPELHARSKRLSFHADDDSKLILDQIKESGFDMAECFATAPMVGVTLEEARRAWGKDVAIWGGVPSVVLEEASMSDEEFEEYMRGVFRAIAPGDAFVLGIGDMAMPRSKIERIERIGQMVEEYGYYPINLRNGKGCS